MSVRPQFALENHEDEIYHSLNLPVPSTTADCSDDSVSHVGRVRTPTDPEYYAFLKQAWVFNRRMRWTEAPGDTLICFCDGGDLPLTGMKAVSKWFTDPVNRVDHANDGFSKFEKHSDRACDCIVLPGLQFCIDQHPTLHIEAVEATTDWQCCVLVKGRGGPPLVAGPWRNGPGTVEIDISAALKSRGYDLHFPELHIAVGLWSTETQDSGHIRFRATLRAAATIVPCLPVVRMNADSESRGVPVSAVVTDDRGCLLTSADVDVHACTGERRITLSDTAGIWHGTIEGLTIGDHDVRLNATGAVEKDTIVSVRITDGDFLDYDATENTLVYKGRATGPLSGSYQGLAYARSVGEPGEALVNGQDEYDVWDRAAPPGEHWHYWEGLTESELNERFAYLAGNNWDLLHLAQHWGIWEKLDAGGRIAPHGAEQAALYYRVAARHGLKVIQALAHYPYGTHESHTVPYQQYLDAGYTDTDWIDPASGFTEMFHGYLRDYTHLFREETAIAFMTTSGEGDIATGPKRANDTNRYVASEDPNHLFLSEPIFSMQLLPRGQVESWQSNDSIIDRWRKLGAELELTEAWEQPLYGSRLYWIGKDIEPELDIGIECKFMQTAPVFMAEGSWPFPDLHRRFVACPSTWSGTEAYRTRVRDTLYLGLVHRIPILLTWEEQLTEDEHRILGAVGSLVDWSRPFTRPQVAVRVDDSCVRQRRSILGQIEAGLTELGLDAYYLTPGEEPTPDTRTVIDSRSGGDTLPGWIISRELPEVLIGAPPITISSGYRVSMCRSQDREILIAYIYNSTHHEEIDYENSLGGRWHRLPKPASLSISVSDLPSRPLCLTLFDLNEKRIRDEVSVEGSWSIDLGTTDRDYLVLVHPTDPKGRITSRISRGGNEQ